MSPLAVASRREGRSTVIRRRAPTWTRVPPARTSSNVSSGLDREALGLGAEKRAHALQDLGGARARPGPALPYPKGGGSLAGSASSAGRRINAAAARERRAVHGGPSYADAVTAAFEARAHRLVEGAFGLLVLGFRLLLGVRGAPPSSAPWPGGGLTLRPRSHRWRLPRPCRRGDRADGGPRGGSAGPRALTAEPSGPGGRLRRRGDRRRHGIDPGLLLRPPVALALVLLLLGGCLAPGGVDEQAQGSRAHRRSPRGRRRAARRGDGEQRRRRHHHDRLPHGGPPT